jgi:putative MATE family efflux protein
MIFGILGMVAFNLADTYFVSQLGVLQVAALSFTFPVVLVIGSLNMGIGIGASVVISNAVGGREQNRVKRLSTDGLSLGIFISVIIMIVGMLTIEPLFRLLGADSATMPYIVEYMRVWYIGVPFVVIPQIGNNTIRALGDTKTPSIIMLIASGMNVVLDPLLIFGIGVFPQMGVTGAALATVIARATTLVFALYILVRRERVVSTKLVRLREIFASWKSILFIGVPNAIAKMIIPIGAGIITSLIASYGPEAVAGYGIATKIEYFAVSVITALVSIIPVFVGQNFGAKNMGRIKNGMITSEKFSVINGIVLFAVLAIFAGPIAHLFTSDENVVRIITLYLQIVPIGYIFMGIVLIVNAAYNALKKPIKAAAFNLIQMMAVYVPLAILTSQYFGIYAIFISLVASYVIVGIAAHISLKKDLNRLEPQTE